MTGRRTRTADGDEHRPILGFRPVAVFDVAQTDGEPLPEVCRNLEGDDPAAWFDPLVDRASDWATRSTPPTSRAPPTATAPLPGGGSGSNAGTTRPSRSRRSPTSWPTHCSTKALTIDPWPSSRPSRRRSSSATRSASIRRATRSATSPAGPGAARRRSPGSSPRVRRSSGPPRSSSTRSRSRRRERTTRHRPRPDRAGQAWSPPVRRSGRSPPRPLPHRRSRATSVRLWGSRSL